MSDDSERRVFSRVSFDGSASISQGSKQWSVQLIDLSLKGLLIEEPGFWDADTSATMKAHIVLSDDSSIHMEVTWRHTNNGQTGFKCEHIDIDSIVHLRRLIELNVGDAKLLERELESLGG